MARNVSPDSIAYRFNITRRQVHVAVNTLHPKAVAAIGRVGVPLRADRYPRCRLTRSAARGRELADSGGLLASKSDPAEQRHQGDAKARATAGKRHDVAAV